MSEKNTVSEKFSMAKDFAKSMVSRGLTNKKTDKITKQLRVISCFGNEKELPPCEYLEISNVDETKHYCGGCGCGDRKGTWLVSNNEEYSKLDYPKLGCPLLMPGFTNYEESEPDEAEEPVTRRYYIEQMETDKIKNIKVSLPEDRQTPKPRNKKEDNDKE